MKIINYAMYLKRYPNCPENVPMELLNNEWALRIHGQTLARLDERGGLNPMEIIVNIEHLNVRAFDTLDMGECVNKLIGYLKSQAV